MIEKLQPAYPVQILCDTLEVGIDDYRTYLKKSWEITQ